jgi:hypothetical protein
VRIIPSSWGSQRTCELHAISDPGDRGCGAPPSSPAALAGDNHPSPRISHLPTFPAGLAVVPATGCAPPLARQGFLASRTPRALSLDPQALPQPFTTPGDAFL